jgi:hypothetical protein
MVRGGELRSSIIDICPILTLIFRNPRPLTLFCQSNHDVAITITIRSNWPEVSIIPQIDNKTVIGRRIKSAVRKSYSSKVYSIIS